MCQRWRVLSLLVLILGFGRISTAQDDDNDPIPSNRLVETWRKHAVDPESPLESRLKDPSQQVYDLINFFRRPLENMLIDTTSKRPLPSGPLRGPTPSPHRLSEAEQTQLQAAIELLPPRHRDVLRWRLRSIMFVDAMVVGGTVLPSNLGESEPLYDIAINASVFGQTASEWVTHKEQSIYLEGSLWTVRVDLGKQLDALSYVLLHEATHLVDNCEVMAEFIQTQRVRGLGTIRRMFPKPNPFLDGVWDRNNLDPKYGAPVLKQIQFYVPERTITAHGILDIYATLANTPLASLYSARSPEEDLAEFTTLYHWTEILHQPYRIIIQVEGAEIMTYEPMKSDLVRARFGAIRRFYE